MQGGTFTDHQPRRLRQPLRHADHQPAAGRRSWASARSRSGRWCATTPSPSAPWPTSPELRPPHRGRRRRRPLHGPPQEGPAGVRRDRDLLSTATRRATRRPPAGARPATRRASSCRRGLVASARRGAHPGHAAPARARARVHARPQRARGERAASPEAELRARGFDVFETGRGGDVTYHGPGPGRRLSDPRPVARPPRRPPLRARPRGGDDPHLRRLRRRGASASPGCTGAWVGDEKIGAIGVRIARWVTSHGFALNVAQRPRRPSA